MSSRSRIAFTSSEHRTRAALLYSDDPDLVDPGGTVVSCLVTDGWMQHSLRVGPGVRH